MTTNKLKINLHGLRFTGEGFQLWGFSEVYMAVGFMGEAGTMGVSGANRGMLNPQKTCA